MGCSGHQPRSPRAVFRTTRVIPSSGFCPHFSPGFCGITAGLVWWELPASGESLATDTWVYKVEGQSLAAPARAVQLHPEVAPGLVLSTLRLEGLVGSWCVWLSLWQRTGCVPGDWLVVCRFVGQVVSRAVCQDLSRNVNGGVGDAPMK